MMSRKIAIVAAALLLAAAAEPLCAWERRVYSHFAAKKYGGQRITVRQRTPRGTVGGILPPPGQVKAAAERFFKALDALPENFVQKSGLRFVTFLERPTHKDIPVGGLASGETIYLNVNCSAQTIYHELFHIFDPKFADPRWSKLNHKDFIYTGSVYRSAHLSRARRRRVENNVGSGEFNADFVSRYAMSNEREDRAETFAAMMAEGTNFLKRAEKSPVLQSKMRYIIDITSKRKLMGRDFWNNHFQIPAGGEF